MPHTGALFIVHAIIIGIKWVRKNPVSFIALASIVTLVALTTWGVFTTSFHGKSTVSIVTDVFDGCEERIDEGKENSVILRLDDIQAFTWGGVSERMIDDSSKRNKPLSLGIIPLLIMVEEQGVDLVNLIKENKCEVEIVLHGWNHREDVPEFSSIGRFTALDKLVRGKTYLETLFDVEVVTFIPPQNVISEEAESALVEAGFTVLSSEGLDYLDYDAATYDFSTNQVISVETVVSECQIAFAEDNVCVVMLHPQDYATEGILDESKYVQYLVLLDELEKLDVSFTTFRDIVE